MECGSKPVLQAPGIVPQLDWEIRERTEIDDDCTPAACTDDAVPATIVPMPAAIHQIIILPVLTGTNRYQVLVQHTEYYYGTWQLGLAY
jgi:hypothetical protein